MLERLRDAGKVRAIGATHYNSSSFPEMQRVIQTGRLTAIQIPYNPFEREVERDTLPLAADLGLGVVIMRPFAERCLDAATPSAKRALCPQIIWCDDVGAGAAQVMLSDTRCHVTIPTTSHVERMLENAAAREPPWFGVEERALSCVLHSVTIVNSQLYNEHMASWIFRLSRPRSGDHRRHRPQERPPPAEPLLRHHPGSLA